MPNGRIAALVPLRNMTTCGLDLSLLVALEEEIGLLLIRLCTVVMVDTVFLVVLQVSFERMLTVRQSLGQALFTMVVTVLLVERFVIKIWLLGTVH